MVNLTRIYTRTGDAGATRLSDLSETTKTDARVEAYGSVDELNSLLGVALATTGLDDGVRVILADIQNELFDLGADLSTPVVANPEWPPLRIEQGSIDRLESWCDEYGDPLPALRSFIIPGGTPAAAWFHLARTVARRAERAGWVAASEFGLADPDDPDGGINPLALTYLNRLSDLLFILARATNTSAGDILWVPGKDREPLDARAKRQRERIRKAGASAD